MRKLEGFFKGVNFGGWLSQCCHTKEHYESFITEKDFAEAGTWGIDHVRIPVDYEIAESEYGRNLLAKAADWCEKYSLNMVLDLHKTAGYSFDSGEGENGFFNSEEYQERFYKIWENFAQQYGSRHKTIAFELLNEVTDECFSAKWNKIAEECIKRIRKYAPDTLIFVGSYHNNSVDTLPALDMPYDDKIVYNFHCYDPLVFTHQAAYWVDGMPTDYKKTFPDTIENMVKEKHALGLENADPLDALLADGYDGDIFEALFADAVKLAEERNVPLYCGEYGVIDRADKESTIEWYKAINAAFVKFGISHAAWSYKAMDFGISDSSFKEDIVKYL